MAASIKEQTNTGFNMDDITKISHIGLTKDDMAVIKSILKLTPNLREKFAVIKEELYQHADLLFVNADDSMSIKLWQALIQQKSNITTILVTAEKVLKFSELAIPYPIQVNAVVNMLSSVVQIQIKIPKHIGNARHTRKRILIVDDSFAVRKYMEQKLPTLQSDYGMILDFAESGKDAMEKIKSLAFDIVFLDVIMPDVDGYKICKWVKKVRPKTNVVMLTSKKSPFDKVRGSMSGCDAYLTKPPEDSKLRKTLEKLA